MADGRVIIEAELNTKDADKQAKNLGNSISRGIGKTAKVASAGLMAVGTAAVATGGAMYKMAKTTAETGDHVDKMSQKLGISAEAYQKWDYVAKISGTSIDGLKMGFKTLTNTIDKANQGNKTAVESFNRIGMSIDDLKGKSKEEIFKQTITSLQNMTNETERSAMANKLLGRAGMELGPMLNSSKGSIDELMKKAEDYGMVMSDKAVKASAKFQDSLTTMGQTFTGLKNRMMAEFLPALTQVTDGLALIFKGDTDEGLKKLESGIKGFADKMLTVIPQVLKIGGTIVKALAESIINNLPQLIQTGTDMLLGLVRGVISALPTVITMALEALTTLLNSLSEQLPTLLTTLVDGLINALLLILDNIPNLIDVAVKFVLALADAILQALPRLIERLPEIISSIFTAIFESLPTIISGFIDLVVKIVEAIPEIIESFLLAIPDMIDDFVSALTDPDNIKKAVDGFISMGKKIIEANKDIIKVFTEDIPNVIKKFFKKMKEKVPEIVEKLKKLVKNVWDHKEEIFKAVKDWFENLPKKIEEWTKGLPDKAEKLGEKIVNFIIMGINFAIIKAGNLGSKLWNLFKNPGKILDLLPKFIDLGKSMILGIFKGWGALVTLIPRMVWKFKVGVIKAFMKAFGIHSPSKVMANEVGKYLAQGIWVGFNEEDPMGQINDAIMNGVQKLETTARIHSVIDYGEMVNAFADAGLTVELENREVGRMVRKFA